MTRPVTLVSGQFGDLPLAALCKLARVRRHQARLELRLPRPRRHRLRSARELNAIGYRGPLSVEGEDSAMERDFGTRDAPAYARRLNYSASAFRFDDALKVN